MYTGPKFQSITKKVAMIFFGRSIFRNSIPKMNRNGTYTGGKRNPLHCNEKSLTDESQHKRNSETNKSTFFPFKPNVNKCDFECPIRGVKLKVHNLVWYFPLLRNDLF